MPPLIVPRNIVIIVYIILISVTLVHFDIGVAREVSGAAGIFLSIVLGMVT